MEIDKPEYTSKKLIFIWKSLSPALSPPTTTTHTTVLKNAKHCDHYLSVWRHWQALVHTEESMKSRWQKSNSFCYYSHTQNINHTISQKPVLIVSQGKQLAGRCSGLKENVKRKRMRINQLIVNLLIHSNHWGPGIAQILGWVKKDPAQAKAIWFPLENACKSTIHIF